MKIWKIESINDKTNEQGVIGKITGRFVYGYIFLGTLIIAILFGGFAIDKILQLPPNLTVLDGIPLFEVIGFLIAFFVVFIYWGIRRVSEFNNSGEAAFNLIMDGVAIFIGVLVSDIFLHIFLPIIPLILLFSLIVFILSRRHS